uniref:Uncharacterized protein n=1 Tax=Mesocestoides corti TaxID=53468 RepID=A0A5K3FGV0_MESCO
MCFGCNTEETIKTAEEPSYRRLFEAVTNRKPEPQVRRRPSESTTLATSTTLYSCLSLVGCITSSHAIGTQGDCGLAEASVVQYVCALIRPCMSYPL